METSQTNNTFEFPEKKTIQTSMFDRLAIIINFVLTFLLIQTVYFSQNQIAIAIVYYCIFAFATAFIVTKTKHFNKKAILPGASALVTAAVFTLHTDEFNYIPFLLLIFLSGSYCVKLTDSSVSSDSSWFYLLDVLYCEFFKPLKHFFTPYISIVKNGIAPKTEHKKTSKSVLWAILGIVLSIPILIVVLPLLKSDIAFSNLTENFDKILEKINIFANIDFFDYFLIFIATCFVAPYIYSVMFSFRHSIAKNEAKDYSKKYLSFRKAPTALVVTVLSIVSVVYLVFLFSRFSYFFYAFKGVLPSGESFSVSTYARNGFFELIKIAVINFVLVFVVTLFAKRNGNKIILAEKLLCLFLSVFTIIIASTSIAKILIYIGEYGLTSKRLLGFTADIVLIIVFAAIILRLFVEKFPYAKIIISTVTLAIIALTAIGPTSFSGNVNADLLLEGKIDNYDGGYEYYISTAPYLSYKKLIENSNDKNIRNNFYCWFAESFDVFEVVNPDDNSFTMYSDEKIIENIKQQFKDFSVTSFDEIAARQLLLDDIESGAISFDEMRKDTSWHSEYCVW